jgi:hypothetical protein
VIDGVARRRNDSSSDNSTRFLMEYSYALF